MLTADRLHTTENKKLV